MSAPAANPHWTPSRGARGAARRFLRAYRYPLWVFALSRTLVLAIVWGIGWVERSHGHWQAGDVFLRPLAAWDGVWYGKIALYGYDPTLGHNNAPAFFPLYPMLIRALGQPLNLDVRLAGILISNLAFLGLCLAFWRLALDRCDERDARRALVYLATFPTAFVFSAVYTESLFLLLAVSAFLLLERRRVAWACVVGALAVLTRPVGIALIPAIAWRVWSDNGRRFDRVLVRRLLPLALLPIASIAFEWFLWYRTGQIMATGAAEERGWGRSVDWVGALHIFWMPLAALGGLTQLIEHRGHVRLEYVVNAVAASFWAILLTIAWLRRRMPVEYLLYASVCILLPALTADWGSIMRLGLAAFPLFWVLGRIGRNEGVDQTLRGAFPALMVALAFVVYGIGTYTP